MLVVHHKLYLFFNECKASLLYFFVLFICTVLWEEGLKGAVTALTASTGTWWGCAGTEAAGHMDMWAASLK